MRSELQKPRQIQLIWEPGQNRDGLGASDLTSIFHPWTVERRCGPQEKAHRSDGHRSAPGRESVPAHRAQPERPQANIAAEIAADRRRIAYGPD